jgi:hypothetical protein
VILFYSLTSRYRRALLVVADFETQAEISEINRANLPYPAIDGASALYDL